jgi:hypothetical protein
MVATATKIAAGPHHLSYMLVGDGEVGPLTIANATILADMVPGPLREAWNSVLTTQAVMRSALLGGLRSVSACPPGCRIHLLLLTAVKDTTAEINQPAIDVDTDATTITKAEINVFMGDTADQVAIMTLHHDWSPAN